MIGLFCFVLAVLASQFESKLRLEAENAVLRHQLIILRRRLRGRVGLTNHDRWFFIQLYRWFPSILKVLTIIRPATLGRGHWAGFRRYWRLSPPACFRDLICDPFCGWMRCDAKPQNMPPAVPHDQQSIEQAKRDPRHDEQIHRGDAVGMIANERPPALGWRVSSPGHILGHAGLSDIDGELGEF